MQGGEDVSIEEITSNISTYRDQLQQVRMLLSQDPGNAEYKDMEKELQEVYDVLDVSSPAYLLMISVFQELILFFFFLFYVWSLTADIFATWILTQGALLFSFLSQVIALTEELLATAKQNEDSNSAIGSSASISGVPRKSNGMSPYEMDMLDEHERFPLGSKVQAVWSEDGEWYDATIEAYTPNGYFVSFDEWGNKEEVDPANVRPPQEVVVDALVEAEKEAEATKQALKRKIALAATSDFQSKSIPAKLKINPDDPEDVKTTKRKKIHAFKSKMRFEQLEVTQNKRQNAWQQFQSTKLRSKKVGFFTGRKRESIFKSPEDQRGKVGVTGSGKGLTEFQRREKHLHLKGGNIDNENAETDD